MNMSVFIETNSAVKFVYYINTINYLLVMILVNKTICFFI